jgi:Carbohydrate binding domain
MQMKIAWSLVALCTSCIAIPCIVAQLPSPPDTPTPPPAPVDTPTPTPPPTDGQNLVGNPGFENGPDISPWTSTGNCWADNGAPPHSGIYFIEFNGGQTTPNGVLSQVINTIPGTTYTLSFWQGMNVYNQTASQKMNVAVVTILGKGILAANSYTMTATAGTTLQTSWTHRVMSFVANTPFTTIQFADDASNPTRNTDLLLDDVWVTAPSADYALETDNDTRTVANGYVTTFHAGKPIAVTDAGLSTTVTPNVTVTTVSGVGIGLAPGVLFMDKSGNPIALSSVKPGTRMQAVEIVDDPNLGQVVREIMVDQ